MLGGLRFFDQDEAECVEKELEGWIFDRHAANLIAKQGCRVLDCDGENFMVEKFLDDHMD
jgi:hypothetical protein